MTTRVDLYDGAYGRFDLPAYREVREETYGQDLGQTSWVTREEGDEIPLLLRLTAGVAALEIGCGSGQYALRVAARTGCRVLGLDMNPHAIANATRLASLGHSPGAASFRQCDVAQGLDVDDGSQDAAYSNDALCHIADRPELLKNLRRALKAGGRFFFSDALVIGGLISHHEIATRTSIGNYIFSPPQENERLLRAAGFQLLSARDSTEQAAEIAARWRHARQKHADQLIAIEGAGGFEGLQAFLACVHTLCKERRLLRMTYLAEAR